MARFSESVSHVSHETLIAQAAIDSVLGERETDASRTVAQTAIALARRVVPERFVPLQSAPDPHGQLLTAYADDLDHVRGLEEKTREGQILAARRILVSRANQRENPHICVGLGYVAAGPGSQ